MWPIVDGRLSVWRHDAVELLLLLLLLCSIHVLLLFPRYTLLPLLLLYGSIIFIAFITILNRIKLIKKFVRQRIEDASMKTFLSNLSFRVCVAGFVCIYILCAVQSTCTRVS